MNDQPPIPPRRRLQELMAIPDSQRSEAEWDELNDLEIKLAPGNREGAPMPNGNTRHIPPDANSQPRRAGGQAPRPAGGQAPKPGAGGQPRKPFKKFHKKPPPKANPQE